VSADASEELNDSLVVAGSDAGLGEDSLAEMGVADTEGELLLLGSFGSRQMSGEEALQSGGHLVRCYALDVFKSLFGGLERLVGRNSHHLGEAFQ
jgi:hypothetical protein